MKNKEEIKEVLDHFTNEDALLELDEESILLSYQSDNYSHSLAIKILSVFGALLGSLSFAGFLLLVGIYDSTAGLLILGALFIAFSIWINIASDSIITDALSVSLFIMGFIFIGFGCVHGKIHMNYACIIFLIIALGSMRIVQNYILSFVSVMIIHGSIVTLILSNKNYDLIHVYISLLAVVISYLFLNEAKIIKINKALCKLYSPVKTGLVISLLSGLMVLGLKELVPVSSYFRYLTFIVIFSAIVYLISRLVTILHITEIRYKINGYVFMLIALLPISLSPAILGAILLLLLSFLVSDLSCMVLAIISFIYFISLYYYNLDFSLLTKSILLISSGVLFIILYLLTVKKLTEHEKV